MMQHSCQNRYKILTILSFKEIDDFSFLNISWILCMNLHDSMLLLHGNLSIDCQYNKTQSQFLSFLQSHFLDSP